MQPLKLETLTETKNFILDELKKEDNNLLTSFFEKISFTDLQYYKVAYIAGGDAFFETTVNINCLFDGENEAFNLTFSEPETTDGSDLVKFFSDTNTDNSYEGGFDLEDNFKYKGKEFSDEFSNMFIEIKDAIHEFFNDIELNEFFWERYRESLEKAAIEKLIQTKLKPLFPANQGLDINLKENNDWDLIFEISNNGNKVNLKQIKTISF